MSITGRRRASTPIVDLENWFTHTSAIASVDAAKYNLSRTEQDLLVGR